MRSTRLLRRRALRPSFVVTCALGAAGIAGACGGNGNGSAGCPAEEPTSGASCDVPSSASCGYENCLGSPSVVAVCQQGTWRMAFSSCNPPAPVVEAGPDAYVGNFGSDAGLDADAAAPDACDGYTIPVCDDGGIRSWCCPAGADCDAGSYCDLGGGACSVGICRDAATSDSNPDGEGQDGGQD